MSDREHDEQGFADHQGSLESRFTRVAVLGTGGMGEVTEHEDRVLGRRVAIKRVREGVSNAPRSFALLEREAKVTGRLQHPNIVPLYDAGRDESGAPYYVMRLLVQPTLAQLLGSLRKGEPHAAPELTLGRLLRCFVQVCNAVDFAHSEGVIHCDLKPANILVGPFGEVVVVDWGFCHVAGEERVTKGGTPGFLAPELLDPKLGPIDPRSDVFSLGAVLYDVLCLQHALPILPITFMLEQIKKGERPFPAPRLPSERAPERKIAPELDEICLRAMAYEPEGRFASARALGEAVEQFLEGTLEKERRARRARELCEQGDGLSAYYRDMVGSKSERQAEVDRLRAEIAPWAPPEQKQALWDAEDREAVMDSMAIRTFQAAVAAYEHALDEVADEASARRGLARLYWDELQRAQARRDEADRVYFEALVDRYDDGALERPPLLEASVVIDAGEARGEIALELLGEVGRRLTPIRRVAAGPSPLEASGLEPGRYQISLRHGPGGEPLRVPLLLGAGAKATVRLPPLSGDRSRPGEVLVPRGPALLGGHATSLLGRELVSIDVPSFFVDRLPVTFAGYMDFLEATAAERGSLPEALLPAADDGSPYFELRGGRATAAAVRRFGVDGARALSLPAFGVDVASAMAFARHRAAATGLAYRLPTEWEWEKAARGVDGRVFPWGDKIDPAFCKMRESRPGAPLPEPPGAFEADESPYGVRDTAGGVAEWVVLSSSSQAAPSQAGSSPASRGGAWCDWRGDCELGARRPYAAGERSARVGFRLVRSLSATSSRARS